MRIAITGDTLPPNTVALGPMAPSDATTTVDGALPLLTLRNLVLFPGTHLPVQIGRRSSLALVDELAGEGAPLLVATQKDEEIGDPTPSDLCPVCVEGTVLRIVRQPGHPVVLVLRGIRRRRVTTIVRESRFIVAGHGPVQEVAGDLSKMDELESSILMALKELAALGKNIPDAVLQYVDENRKAIELSDLVASLVELSPGERASLLVQLHLPTRRYRLLTFLERRLTDLGVTR